MQLQNTMNYKVSTSDFGNVLRAISALNLDEIVYVVLGALVEIIAYSQARTALSKEMIPCVWEPVKSTKIQL
jgi:prophage antirepressor-like protein